MAPVLLLIPSLLTIIINLNASAAADPDLHSTTRLGNETTLEWRFQPLVAEMDQEVEEGDGNGPHRRSLYWKTWPQPAAGHRYYISYGALTANRIPCPPRSCRSYYTHNCFEARGPVHPYTRGCSAITRCRR